MSDSFHQILPRRGAGRLAVAGLVAGLLGGSAEILWVSLIAPATGADAIAVAHEVTATLFPLVAGGTLGVVLGLAIHLALSLALGLAVALGVQRILPAGAAWASQFALVMLALALVWAVNFALILPAVNPTFVALLPLWASFASNLLFGLAAALALIRLR